MPIPPSRTSLALPMQDLLKLPPAASYDSRGGRATLKVRRSGDTIYVDAGCDSLQALCAYYERELAIYSRQKEQQRTVVEKHSIPVQTVFKHLFVGIIAGVIGTLLFIKKKR